MKPVTEYEDYRIYMKDYYDEKKRVSSFSWREYARASGFTSPTYLKLVCECKTSDGNKVWVSFSTSDYKKYIDSNVNTFVTLSNSADTIYFSPAAKRDLFSSVRFFVG